MNYVKGRSAGSEGTAPKRYQFGRVCVEDDCDTVLSVYNRTAHCWVHDPGRSFSVRGARRRKVFVLSST